MQFLRLLLDEPNVLLLDEPTNDLDIDTLTVIEDYLDGWPGTLIVVTHDRYFLERVTDVTYALTGGGRCDMLPGGIEQYLSDRAARSRSRTGAGRTAARRDGLGAGTAGGKGDGPHRESTREARQADRHAAPHDGRGGRRPVRAGELNAELNEC